MVPFVFGEVLLDESIAVGATQGKCDVWVLVWGST